MEKIKGCISQNPQKIKGCITSLTQSLCAKVGSGGASKYYYTKAEIDQFRIEDREYVDAQDLILQSNIDASGHKIVLSLNNNILTSNLLDANDNIISTSSVELEDQDKYIDRAEYNSQTQSIIFYYNDGTSFSVSISSLVTSLELLIQAETTRATEAENLLSRRISDIEEDYLTSSDKSDLESQISNVQTNLNTEITNRENADTALQTNITNEATARQSADTALSNRIDNIENAGYITQDINTSSIAVQYTKSTSKVSLISTHEWHEYEGATESLLLSCAYGNGYYIAVGNDGVIVYSNDGQNWNLFGNMSNQPTIDKIVYGNGYFLAMSYTSRTIYKAYMPNGWTIQTTIEDTINPTNLLYVNNHFILTGENGYIGFSQDGKKFKQLNTNISNIKINSVAYGNTVYLAVGDNGLLLYSKTGEVWNNITESQVDNYKNIIFYNGVFILSTDRFIRYSTDYYQFYDSSIPDLTIGSYNIQNMVAGESNFYVIATNNTNTLILNSANGQTFSTEYVANIAAYGITYGKENFITVGTGNKVYNLNLQINWTYNKPVISSTEYLWARDVNNLNNGDTLYSQAYFMGYVDKDTDELVNYYTIPTTDDLLDGKQDDMVAIENSSINNLFN
jgi:hypothetical protein